MKKLNGQSPRTTLREEIKNKLNNKRLSNSEKEIENKSNNSNIRLMAAISARLLLTQYPVTQADALNTASSSLII